MMPVDLLALAKSLIHCPSVTPEDHGALDVVQNALEKFGFSCRRLSFSQEGEPTVDNLYARLGTALPHLCFAGHTDVVPPGELSAWESLPFLAEVRDGYLYGRGTEDMKGAIACMISAVADYLEEKKGFGGSISFLITGDEEGFAINGTRKVVGWMKEHGEIPDAAIVGEPTNPEAIGDMIKIGRRGSMNMILTVKGKQGHVAYPHLADNPVTVLIDILHAIKHAKIDDGMDFFQASNLEVTSVDVGNPAKNVIPGEARANINIRFNPLHDSKKMVEWLKAHIEKFTTSYDLAVRVTGEAFLTPPGPFSALMTEAVEKVTGRRPELSTSGGTSDARFIKDICPVAEFGTTGKTPHMVNERVKVEDLHLLKACYLEILRRYFK